MKTESSQTPETAFNEGNGSGSTEQEAPPLANKECSEQEIIQALAGVEAKTRRLLIKMLKKPDEVDDAWQEISERIWQALSEAKFRGESTFDSWVYRIATNEANSRLKNKKNNPLHYASGEGTIDEPRDHGPNPEELLRQKQLTEQIARVMRVLSERDQNILLLRDRDNLPVQKIADIYGYGLSNTKTLIHRARKRFRKEFTRQQLIDNRGHPGKNPE